MRFSEAAARAHGLTPRQHQLLLAIKGAALQDWVTVGEVAERLQLCSHTVVGLIDRAQRLGLVMRVPGTQDHRVTEVHLTSHGQDVLESLTMAHRDELARTGWFVDLLGRLERIGIHRKD